MKNDRTFEEKALHGIELLAPARNLECGKAAVDCGADAVYLGGDRFGAREDAGNSLEDIGRLAEYAHKYWVRVYAAVNTLLTDDEIPQAVELIGRLHEAGVDGIIIQDAGLLECDLPPVPIIASTQMHNNTPEKVAFLEKVGVKRAILARELDLGQIGEIRRRTGIELETFIHGALCICYSGQCYLSYALGGRSGNRGECAQPCRRAYDLLEASGRVLTTGSHLLSPRDLNLSDHLRDLLEAGVSSFKIEGRLKDRAYVANVVAHYRALLDSILPGMGLERSSSGRSVPGFEPDICKTFNRGYTTYFLNGRGEEVASLETPKMVGELLGRVIAVRGDRVSIATTAKLHPGDGIAFFDRNGNLSGTLVNESAGGTARVGSAEGLRPGMPVYRNHDHEFLTRIEKSRPVRTISVEMTLFAGLSGLRLRVKDADGVHVECTLPGSFDPAEKSELAHENLERQLRKTGGTEFECAEVCVEGQPVPFVPAAAINALRREALEALTLAREKARPRPEVKTVPGDYPYPARELDFSSNVLNAKAREFYSRHGVTAIESAAESGLDMRGRRVMTTRYCVREQLGICPRRGGRGATADPLFLRDAEGRRLRMEFNCADCGMEIYLCSE